MAGGELKIEVLPAGSVVPAFGLLEAVYKGTLDGGHGVLAYHYGKQNALALWGSGPAYGMDANMLLAWHNYGGGKELLEEIYESIGAQRGVVPVRADADPAARLVQEAGHQARGLQGPQVPHRRPRDRHVHRDGRGGQPAARRRNRAGDGPRPARRGRVQQRQRPTACSASPTCRRSACCRAITRAPSSSRSRSTRPSTTRCPTKLKAIIANAVEAASPTWSGRRSTATRRTTSSCRRRTSQVLQDARRDPAGAARRPGTRWSRRSRREPDVQGDRRVAEGLRRARGQVAAATPSINRRMANNHYFGPKRQSARRPDRVQRDPAAIGHPGRRFGWPICV